MRSNHRTLMGLLFVCLMLASPAICRATTQTITVTTDSDAAVHTGVSLRDAITTANKDTGDTIKFNIPGTGPFTITLLTSPLPTITSSMTIAGGTTPATGITIDINQMVQAFAVNNSTTTLNLNDLTFKNGSNPQGLGGGIHIGQGTVVNVTNCAFLDNVALVGGAIFLGRDDTIGRGGTLNVTNSTFSGNNGLNGGGAIFDNGTLNVTNSTFSGNIAPGGAGIYVDFNFGGATANLKGTILAANPGGGCSGSLNDEGYNINDDGTCGFSPTGSANNGDPVNPMLEAIANNGGPTETFALMTGSPAIDAIPMAACTFLAGPNPCTTIGSITNQLTCDQRGFGRPDPGDGASGNCDIGAYESGAVPHFAGQPGAANCVGVSVSELATQFGGINLAAEGLGFSSVQALQDAIIAFCAG